eukprot:8623176-Pyramimonas_sp.AAC.1
MKLGAAILLEWPKLEFRGAASAPRSPPKPTVVLARAWKRMSGFWRCEVCLKGSVVGENVLPPDSVCPGRSRLDRGVLERLQHKVVAFPCSDASFLLLCLR